MYLYFCWGTDPPPPKQKYPQIGNLPVLNVFTSLSQSSNFFLPPLRQDMTASAFFTHGYFQQPHVHISEAIITD